MIQMMKAMGQPGPDLKPILEVNGDHPILAKIKESDEFAKKWGNLGPVYGYEWRHFDGPNGQYKDQLAWVINEIKTNPNSRRLIVNSWQACHIDKMALPPCHTMFQFYVANNKLSCQLYQRS